MSEIEHFFSCPYCAAPISMLFDLSAGGQTYIEDCEVCCRAIEVSYQVKDTSIADFRANTTY